MLLALASCLWGLCFAILSGSLFSRRWLGLAVAHGLTAVASALLAGVLLYSFADGGAAGTGLALTAEDIGLPWTGFRLKLDGLSAFFLLLLALAGLGASLYGLVSLPVRPRPVPVLPFVSPEDSSRPLSGEDGGMDDLFPETKSDKSKKPSIAPEKVVISAPDQPSLQVPLPGPDPAAALIPALLLACGLVIIASDAFSFTLGWTASMVLVWLATLICPGSEISRGGDAPGGHSAFVSMVDLSGRSASVTLATGLFGCLALICAFGLMAVPENADAVRVPLSAADFSFTGLRQTPGAARMSESSTVPDLVLWSVPLLLILATGCMAGIVPLHIWTPFAATALPFSLSCLVFSLLPATALYALIRFLFDLLALPGHILPGPDGSSLPPGTGLLVPGRFALPVGVATALMLAGALTAFTGSLQALMQKDARRLLAYISLETVGRLLALTGLALLFAGADRTDETVMALTALMTGCAAWILHAGLLFPLLAFACIRKRSPLLDGSAGGLRAAPVITILTLLLILSVSGLPPLAGFTAHWMAVQALLSFPGASPPLLQIAIPVVLVVITLSASLTLLAWLRAWIATSDGNSQQAGAEGRDGQGRLLLALTPLLLLLLLFWLLPGLAAYPAEQAAHGLLALSQPSDGFLSGGWQRLFMLPAQGDEATQAFLAPAITGFLFLSFLSVLSLLCRPAQTSRGGKSTGGTSMEKGLHPPSASLDPDHGIVIPPLVRASPSWQQGRQPGQNSFTPAGLARPARQLFARPLMAAEEEVLPVSPADPSRTRFTRTMRDPFWRYLFRPLALLLDMLSRHFSRFEKGYDEENAGRRNLRLTLLFMILLLLAVLVFHWPGQS